MSDPRRDLIEAGRDVFEGGLVKGRAGNISLRMPENRILISHTGSCLGSLADDGLMVINLQGDILEGEHKPSTEFKAHLAVYLTRPDVGAVVHTHSTYASVAAYLKLPLLKVNPETSDVVGKVGRVPALAPGTQELAVAVAKALGSNGAVLMERHGALTVGINMREAVNRAFYLEEACKMSYLIERFEGANAETD
ncbi:MAG: class II aldolase/adducin family protein [Actinomycetota bacterium]